MGWLSLLSGLFSFFNKLMGWESDREQRQAGAAEASLQGKEEVDAAVKDAVEAGAAADRDFGLHGVPIHDPQARD